jgi:hypothetical protein
MSDLSLIVWKVLYGPPIDLVDDEKNAIYLEGIFELTQPRTSGEYIGSREIGSANIMTAYNLVHMKKMHDTAYDSVPVLDLYKEVLNSLAQDKLIRKKPEKVRETFKVVT